MKEDYLLVLLGSSIDIFYQSEHYPAEGDYSHAAYQGRMAGGPPLNVGSVCASKGVTVKALDCLNSEDESSQFLLEHLKSCGVDTEAIQYRPEAVNGQVVIIVSSNKRTMFVIDPKRPHYAVDEKMQQLLNNARYIYALMHIVDRSFENWKPLEIARQHGAKVILDGSSQYESPDRARMIYELADGLFINETDYQRLSAVSDGDPIEKLLQRGADFVCLTKGEQGSELHCAQGVYQTGICAVDVVDSTGAGDAFAGGFLAALLKGKDYAQALRYGSANGAYACTRFGGSAGACSLKTLLDFAKAHHYEIEE